MQKLINTLLLSLLLPLLTNATNYYISNAGNNSNNGTSTSTSWLTMAKVETAAKNGTIQPGDSILFKRGDSFTPPDKFNGMQWWGWGGNTAVSGTQSNPIVISAYGSGTPPNFTFANPASTDSVSRICMSFEGVSWIIVDGLNFVDSRSQPNYKLRAAFTTGAIALGETGSGAETFDCIIRNCTMTKLGLGVVICGSRNTITNCTGTDFGNVYAIGTGSYGANFITITGKHNNITYNYGSGAWAYSSAFGWNGGGIEMFNTCDSNNINYNTFIDCGGITEFGATASSQTCKGNVVAYNKIINCGNIAYGNFGSSFPVTPDNNQYYNNVYVENSYSRFSGPNFGTGATNFPTWPTLPVPETLIFANAGSPSATTVWKVQNNIIQNENNMDVYQSSSSKFSHLNNLYKLSGGSALGYTINGTEATTSGQIYVTESGDPTTWDYHLTSTSPARGIAVLIASLTQDFYGVTIAPPYNAGIDGSSAAPTGNTITFPAVINGVLYNGIQ